MLEDGDRVHAVEAARGNLEESVVEVGADEAHLRAGGAKRLVLDRPVPGAVVRVDEPHVVPEPRQQVGDERLAGADLQQLASSRHGGEDRLQGPRPLHVLQISLGGRERLQVVEAVREVADGRVRERRRLVARIAVGDRGERVVVEPGSRQRRHSGGSDSSKVGLGVLRREGVTVRRRRTGGVRRAARGLVASSQARPWRSSGSRCVPSAHSFHAFTKTSGSSPAADRTSVCRTSFRSQISYSSGEELIRMWASRPRRAVLSHDGMTPRYQR